MKKRRANHPTQAQDQGGNQDRLFDMRSCQKVRCVDCGNWQCVTKGQLGRASMPRCRSCGGLLEWTKGESKRIERKEKGHIDTYDEDLCKECGKKLSRYNSNILCFVCQKKF